MSSDMEVVRITDVRRECSACTQHFGHNERALEVRSDSRKNALRFCWECIKRMYSISARVRVVGEGLYSDDQTAEILERASIDKRTLNAAVAGKPLRHKSRQRLLDALLALDLQPPPTLTLTAGERQAFGSPRRPIG